MVWPVSSWLASLPTDRQSELASLVQQSKMQAAASFFRLAEVPVGEPVKIEFQAACYEPLTMQLAVPEQDVDWTHPTLVRPELRRVELKTETGFLEVSSTPPGAEVWLDGSPQGQTPLRKDVCVGTHRIHVVHRARQYVQEVNVRPGQAARVSGELRPTIAFLGIYAQNPQNNQLTPVSADWDTVARRISVRSSAFVDPVITAEEIDSLRKKEILPVEKLFQDRMSAADMDMLLKKISGDVLRVDLLLVGLRAGNRYSFRLYNAIHPTPDLVELPSLDEASLDFLISQLNKAERIGERLQVVDLGVELIDTPKGLMVLNPAPAVAGGNPMIASGAIINTIDQRPMVSQELQSCLRAKKPGQAITLEVQGSKDTATKVPIDIGRRSPAVPVTPPCVRVRTRRFGGLSYRPAANRKRPIPLK